MAIDRFILVTATVLAGVLLQFGADGAASASGAGYLHIAAIAASGAIAAMLALAIFNKE